MSAQSLLWQADSIQPTLLHSAFNKDRIDCIATGLHTQFVVFTERHRQSLLLLGHVEVALRLRVSPITSLSCEALDQASSPWSQPHRRRPAVAGRARPQARRCPRRPPVPPPLPLQWHRHARTCVTPLSPKLQTQPPMVGAPPFLPRRPPAASPQPSHPPRACSSLPPLLRRSPSTLWCSLWFPPSAGVPGSALSPPPRAGAAAPSFTCATATWPPRSTPLPSLPLWRGRRWAGPKGGGARRLWRAFDRVMYGWGVVPVTAMTMVVCVGYYGLVHFHPLYVRCRRWSREHRGRGRGRHGDTCRTVGDQLVAQRWSHEATAL